jgi:hypothetical protein
VSSESRTATKAQVMRLANKLNVNVDDESTYDDVCIFLYTPKGLRFNATDCHTAATSFSRLLPGEYPNDYQGTKAQGWGHVMDDLEYGVEECPNENCGFCERGLMNE